jgi:hypothetical protein
LAVAHYETKQCTKCLEYFPHSEFYSKGKRIDAQCKACVKSAKKTKYVSRESQLGIDRLIQFFDIVTHSEIRTIKTQIEKLDEVYLKCCRKTVP